MTALAKDAWAPGPRQPSLADGVVHVWRADLAAVSSDIGELLCEEERARAERIVNKPDGELWRRSRGVLRELLGRYLQSEPSSLRFSAGEHGKPALLTEGSELSSDRSPDGTGRDRLFFNMSHSDGIALYALSHAGAVGIDVEVRRRPIDAVAIAARMLGAEQAQRLQALDPEVRQREFLRAWVRYEAELKCVGVGIGGTPAEGDQRVQSITELELGPSAAGAVATALETSELRCWAWQAV
jgi:4'-phosphopantetheinyl transferase